MHTKPALMPLLLAVALLACQVACAQTPPACAAAWNSASAYNGGDVASESGVNYLANWWTQGDEPITHNGGSGSGQPWTSQGACEGGPVDPVDDPIFKNGFDAAGGTPPVGFVFSPYKDVTINLDWNTNVMRTAVTGSVIPLVGTGGLMTTVEPDLHAITLAFATGECGSENWGGIAPAAFVDANISALSNAGVDYVISTGGAAGVFTCASASGMTQFIARYASPHLVGIDFDIEGGQTPAQINALVAGAAAAQQAYPNLRFSFTLATLAASDGSHGGLNTLGDTAVHAIQASNLVNYTINLMVMDYGSAGAGVCVVSGGTCDMGQSAIQAASNLMHTYGVPAAKIELTPMIGMNDVVSEIFSLADVDTVMNYAVSQGLAGVHYWSLDRDTPCAGNQGSASSTCNSVVGTTPLQYTERFLLGFSR
jgi:hypothetical protein